MDMKSTGTKFGLTPTQAKCLAFIKDFLSRHPHSPSYRQISKATGMKAISQVNRVVLALEQRGHIARVPGMHRSVTVLRT